MSLFGGSTSDSHKRAVSNPDTRKQLGQLKEFLDLANKIADQYVERKNMPDDDERAQQAKTDLTKYRSDITQCSKQAEVISRKLSKIY